jgi:hypothetical protein
MGPAGKFIRLPYAEQRLVIGAALAVAATRLMLWTLPFRAVRRIVARFEGSRTTGLERPSADRITWAVAVTGRFIPGGDNCLVKAIAAELMLSRFGYPSELKFGVGKSASGDFEAHAWLESEGRVMIGEFEPGSYSEMVGSGASRL